MSTSIDDRIVRLKVESGQFTAGIQTAISALNQLKGSLKMQDVVSGLDKVSSSMSNFSLGNLKNKVMDVQSQFPLLQTAGAVALGGLAIKAATAGASMVKSLALDGITSGFKEYELNLNSVQTILANTKSKGEDINSVNDALSQLNKYADKTIYSFSDMTSNIGRFTAAGVGLQDSVDAIQGLSNLAAASGSSAQQASGAMYQLSQAISSGTVRLMDWNSVQTAGMSGTQFQEALLRTARAHGVAVDDMIKKNGSFRDSLKEGWLTSDIMLESLRLMTDQVETLSDAQLKQMGYTQEDIKHIRDFASTAFDAATKFKTWTQVWDTTKESIGSGWATTWQYLIGDFKQASELWTKVGNGITGFVGRIAEARNAYVKSFVDMGGRTAVLNTLFNLFTALTKPLKAIGKAFGQVFGGGNAAGLATFAKALEKLAAGFVISDSAARNITRTFVGIFSIIKALITPIGWVVKIIGVLTYAVIRAAQWIGDKFTQALFGVTRWIEPFGVALNAVIQWLDPLGRLVSVAGTAFKIFMAIVSPIGKLISTTLAGPLKMAHDYMQRFADGLKKNVNGPLANVKAKLDAFGDTVINAVKKLDSMAGSIGQGALMAFVGVIMGLVMALKWLADVFQAQVAPAIMDAIDYLGELRDLFVEVFNGRVVDGATGIEKGVVKVAESLRTAYDKASDFFGGFFKGSKKSSGAAKSFATSAGSAGIAIGLTGAAASDATEQLTFWQKAIVTAQSKWQSFTGFLGDSKNVFTNAFSGGKEIKSLSSGVIGQVQKFALAMANMKNVPLGDSFKAMGSALAGFVVEIGKAVGADIPKVLEDIKAKFKEFGASLKDFWNSSLSGKADKLGAIFKSMGAKVSAAVKSLLANGSLPDLKAWFNKTLPGIFENGVAKIKSAKKAISDEFTSMGESIKGFVKKYFTNENLAALTQGFTLGGLAATIVTFARLGKKFATDLDEFTHPISALSKITKPFTESFDKFTDTLKGFQAGIKAKAIKDIAISLAILAASLLLLALIPGDKLADVLVTSAANITALSLAFKAMAATDADPKKLAAMGVAFIGIGAAVALIAMGAAMLAKLDTQSLIQGSIAIGAIIFSLKLFMEAMSKISGTKSVSMKNVIAMIGTAATVYLLAKAVQKLGSIPLEELIAGTAAASFLLVAIGLFAKLGGGQVKISAAIAFLAVAWAMVSIANVIQKLGTMDMATAKQGLDILLAVMADIAIAFIALSTNGNQMGTALTFLALAATLIVIGNTLTTFANMPTDLWLHGVTQLGLTLLALVAAMNFAQGGAVGAAAILIMVAALWALTPVITALGALPWETTKQGLAAIGVALAILVVAAAGAQMVGPGLLILAGSIALLGVAALAVGAGMMMFAAGLATMAGSAVLVVGAIQLLATAAVGLTGSLGAMLALAGTLAVFGIGLGIFGAAALIAAAGSAALGGSMMLLASGLVMIMAVAPSAANTIKTLVKSLADLVGVKLLKAGAAGVALAAIGVSLLAFGVAALAASVGAIALRVALVLVNPLLETFSQVFDKFTSALGSASSVSGNISQIATAIGSLATVGTTGATGLIRIPMALAQIQVRSMAVTAAVTGMGLALSASFTAISASSAALPGVVGAAMAAVGVAIAGLASAVTASAPGVTAAFVAMSIAVSGSLAAFVRVISSSAGQVSGAMAALAAASRAGSQSVATSMLGMSAGANSAFSLLQGVVSRGATNVGMRMQFVAKSMAASTNGVTRVLQTLTNNTSSAMTRLNVVANRGVTAVGITFARMPMAIQRGTSSALSILNRAVSSMQNAAVSRLNAMQGSVRAAAYSVGAAISQGMANGISSNSSTAISAASSVAARALSAAKAQLDIHSPSRKFFEVGMYAVLGMAKGFDDNSKTAEKSATNLAANVLAAGSFDLNPTITPVVDMSNVEESANSLSSMFRGTNLDLSGSVGSAQSVAYGLRQNGSSSADSTESQRGTNVNFTQINNSPKALDRLEIYRQTQRANRQIEGVLKAR